MGIKSISQLLGPFLDFIVILFLYESLITTEKIKNKYEINQV